MKIGVMFGNPETTTGGHALKFYASVRLDIRRIGAIKDGEEVVGNRTRVKVVKNKVAPPVPRGRVRHPLQRGHLARGRADRPRRRQGRASRRAAPGSRFGDERIGQGRENARLFLKEHPDVRERVADAVYAAKGLKRRVPARAPSAAPEPEATASEAS